MISRSIKEYLTKREIDSFGVEEFSNKYRVMEEYRNNTGATAMIEIGMRIWTGDLDYGVFKETKTMRNYINVVKTDLLQKLARLISYDIDVRLQNNLNKQYISQDVLEDELNYSLDYWDILLNSNLSIQYNLFGGFGMTKVGWDKYKVSQAWETGVPTTRVIDCRNMLLDTNIQQDNMSDMEIIMELKTFKTETLAENLLNDGLISTEEAEEINEKIKDFDIHNDIKSYNNDTNNARYQKTDVVICQYKKPYRLTIRKIKDYIGGDEAIFEALEDDIKAVISPENYGKLTDKDDDSALPEGIKASEPINKRVDSWFEIMFIPSMNLLITPPVCIGDRCTYIPYAGMKNPNSSYPISKAYEQAQLLNLHSIILSILLKGAVKQFNAIPCFIAEGIDNLKQFLAGYESGDVKLQINEEWAEKNPGQKPWNWMKAPQSSGDLQILLNMLQQEINQATASTPILSGESPGSHASGELVSQLSQNAIDSSKDDYFPWLLHVTNICEVVKNLTAEYKNYPHEYNYNNDIIMVNEEDEDGNRIGDVNLLEAAPNCFVRVLQADTNDQIKAQEKQEVRQLYQDGMVTYEYAIRRLIDYDTEEVIDNMMNQNTALALLTELRERPEIMQQVQKVLEQAKQQEAAAQGAEQGAQAGTQQQAAQPV